MVSAAQLDAAAQILREADPSVCNGISQERPGWIDAKDQEDESVLVFRLGILPSITFRIDRKGNVR